MVSFLREFSLVRLFVLLSVGLLAYTYIDRTSEPNQSDSNPIHTETNDGGTVQSARQDKKTPKKPDSGKAKPPSIEAMGDPSTSNKAARVLGVDDYQYQTMKEDYFCDLAKTAWENCELQLRNEADFEVCLKMGGYYTNSRHCGYQP